MKCSCPTKFDDHSRAVVRASLDQFCPIHGEKKLCAIEGCNKPVSSRGWCSMHLARWTRHGDPLVRKFREPKPAGDYESMVLRFWKMVAIGNPASCWEWKATGRRYGSFHVGKHFPGFRRLIPAHKASYLINRGPIQNGLHVLHACDNCMCVNPAHLYLGTHQDNMKDRAERGRTYTGGPRGPSGKFVADVPIVQTPETAASAARQAAGENEHE